ncbi:lipocalin-like domain-containing protein [Rariglobus hedericola]|uniref:Carotenoid 1,2-hydratase n=1 Tax=Rariglobus hedericola TaxID=2597822 RepID=A0A556QNX9_9BACT|nr:lipocalin-like domain-containing protein [Rariglobus hedericola]TSJ78302.1 carotenoid 1,2-hydratase [Rariglobus hedericola]
MRHILIFFCAVCALCGQTPTPLVTAEGFAVPQPGHVFSFPRDHGSHSEFKIEWWYITGHLAAADGRRFGYQATFFRSASADKTSQLHLAHMALTDVGTGKFYYQERLNREGWDAGASTSTLDVHNGPWSLRFIDETSERMELRGGVRAEGAFNFTLTPTKPLVVFGENSISRKGSAPTAASYYLTFTRLRTEGVLTLGEESLKVTGESWMDHEISSSQLDQNQIGWDWVSIHFKDGRELMFYRLRLRDGTADPASSLTWVDAAGHPKKSSFTWDVLDRWTSPRTGAVYPSRVRLISTDPATGKPAALTLEPLVKNQELSGSLGGIPYWEGACRVLDADGREVGSAYMELTGYAKDLKL